MRKFDLAVTVTGASGFVGSNLCRRLLNDEKYNIRVFGADLQDSRRLKDLHAMDNFTFEEYSVHQPLHSDMLAVDTLYHFAGIANPKLYLERPIDVMDLNLVGLRNILDRVIRWDRGRPRVVFSSTSEVYGKNSAIPFREDTTDLVFGPTQKRRWCYAMSKAVCEHYLQSFGDQVPYTIFRFFNFVGNDIDAPGAGRVITSMVGDAINFGKIRVTHPGSQSRTFVCTEDFVEALMMPTVLKREREDFRKQSQILNIGSDEEVTMSQLAVYINELLLKQGHIGKPVPIVIRSHEELYGPGYEDVHRRVPDVRKIKEEFGWEAKRRLGEFLPAIVSAAATESVQGV